MNGVNIYRKRRERKRKKEFAKSILLKHKNSEKLRLKANQELKILMEIYSKDYNEEINVLNEIKIHLEATQKEINYYGYRGIIIGLIVVILSNLIATKIFPPIFEIAETVSNFPTPLEKIIYQGILTLFCIFIFGLVAILFLQTTGPFFKKEKNIREQIYINEFNIRKIDEKIKDLENKYL